MKKPANTNHLTYRGALRARRRWLKSRRGRDGYVHRGGKLRYFVSYIDYERPKRDPEQQSLKDAHSHAADVAAVLSRFTHAPTADDYAQAINLAAHLVAALSAGDHHRRFAEAEGLPRGGPVAVTNMSGPSIMGKV